MQSLLFHQVLLLVIRTVVDLRNVAPQLLEEFARTCTDARNFVRGLSLADKVGILLPGINRPARCADPPAGYVRLTINRVDYDVWPEAEQFFARILTQHFFGDNGYIGLVDPDAASVQIYRKMAAQAAVHQFVPDNGWQFVAIRDAGAGAPAGPRPACTTVVQRIILGRPLDFLLAKSNGKPVCESDLISLSFGHFMEAAVISGVIEDLRSASSLFHEYTFNWYVPGVRMSWLTKDLTIYDKIGPRYLACFRDHADCTDEDMWTRWADRKNSLYEYFTSAEMKVLRDRIEVFDGQRTIEETRALISDIRGAAAAAS